MRLVGAIPALPTDYVIYAANPKYGVGATARRFPCYGIVSMDGDDAPGRMVPFVPGLVDDGTLRPWQDVEDAVGIVHDCISPQDALDAWYSSMSPSSP